MVRVDPTEKVTFERRSREEEAVNHVDICENDNARRYGEMVKCRWAWRWGWWNSFGGKIRCSVLN